MTPGHAHDDPTGPSPRAGARVYRWGVRRPRTVVLGDRSDRHPPGALFVGPIPADRPRSPTQEDTIDRIRPFASLERFLERLFERPGARLFRARPQPVVLARRLERAVDRERRVGPGGLESPTRFEVALRPDDLASVAPDGDAAAALEEELAAAALAHARRRRYGLRERPTVILVADAALPAGEIDVRARFAGSAARSGRAEPPPIEQTMVRPLPPSPRAGLRVRLPGAVEQSVILDGSSLTIGRAPDNDLVLADARVSRHHARISGRAGRLVLADLGSTNGTLVNGARVTEIVLGFGDQLSLGTTLIEVVEVAEAREPVAAPGPDGSPRAGGGA